MDKISSPEEGETIIPASYRPFLCVMASQKNDVDNYIREFPIAIFKYYYELRLDDVFA